LIVLPAKVRLGLGLRIFLQKEAMTQEDRRYTINGLGGAVGVFVAAIVLGSSEIRFPIDLATVVLGGYLGAKFAQVAVATIDPEWRLQAKVESRKRTATRRRIRSKAWSVVTLLGRQQEFEDAQLYIFDSGGKIIIKTGGKAKGRLVFEATGVAASNSTQHLGTYLEPQEDGGYRVAERTQVREYKAHDDIAAYVPGRWEAHLEMLAKRAETRRLESERWARINAEQEKQQKQRERFGL
jgi:hypothetical protein